ncbi:MAG TPA: type II toxin-antitoxin system RelE/ParE family toxin [Acetobacteraceae bacterium]
MEAQLTEAADHDVVDILRETARRFGPFQRAKYAEIIGKSVRIVADDPERPGSRRRDDLVPGLRSLHLEIAARRRGAASHVLYYLRGRLNDGSDGVIIARVLYDGMEPLRHLSRDLP